MELLSEELAQFVWLVRKMSYRPVDQHPESTCTASCTWTLVQSFLSRMLENIVIYRYIVVLSCNMAWRYCCLFQLSQLSIVIFSVR